MFRLIRAGLQSSFGKPPFDLRQDGRKQIFALQVRTGLAVRELTTLARAGGVNVASRPDPVEAEKNAGTVGPDFERVFPLQVSLPHHPVGNTEIPGDAIDIERVEIERGSRQSIAAIAGTKRAV